MLFYFPPQPDERGRAGRQGDPAFNPCKQKAHFSLLWAVEGALCRLHQMGAKVILNPLASIRRP